MIVYLVTDAGLGRPVLVAVPIGSDGRRGHVGAIAERDDAELELVDADRDGRTLLLVWNVGGRSEVELRRGRAVTGARWPWCPGRSSAAGS